MLQRGNPQPCAVVVLYLYALISGIRNPNADMLHGVKYYEKFHHADSDRLPLMRHIASWCIMPREGFLSMMRP